MVRVGEGWWGLVRGCRWWKYILCPGWSGQEGPPTTILHFSIFYPNSWIPKENMVVLISFRVGFNNFNLFHVGFISNEIGFRFW